MNVNGIKRNSHPLVEHHLHKIDIACIQETKFRDVAHRENFEHSVLSKYAAKIFVNDQNSEQSQASFPRSGGVMTVIHSDFPGVDTAVIDQARCIPNRYLVVKVVSADVRLYIHNVYAPVVPSEKKAFFESLPTDFEPDVQHIVCGDFNTAIDIELDSARHVRHNDTSQAELLVWLGHLRVSDAWRVHNPTSRVFSGPLPRVNRLDYVFLSEDLLCQLYGSSKYFKPPHGGDHLAHLVVLVPPQQLQGRGYWRFPRYLFEYPQVIDALKREVETLVPVIESATNPGIVWQVWKKRVGSMLQRLCARIREDENKVVRDAEERVERLARLVATDSADPVNDHSVQAEYEEARQFLQQVLETKAKYTQDTAFDKYVQESERSTSWFFRPPATHLRRTPIESVTLPDGTESTDANVIALTFNSHWGGMMGVGDDVTPTPSMLAAQTKLLDSVTRTLTSEQQTSLDSTLTEAEIEAAIKSMSPHKAPGPDGFTAAFYQIAPSAFAKILLRVFTYQLSRGVLLPEQRKSCVVLLHKKGSRSLPGNYRPATHPDRVCDVTRWHRVDRRERDCTHVQLTLGWYDGSWRRCDTDTKYACGTNQVARFGHTDTDLRTTNKSRLDTDRSRDRGSYQVDVATQGTRS